MELDAGPSALDHFPDADRQLLDGERLGDHLHAGIQETMGDGGILRIAGDEENLQIGTALPRLIRKLTSVQTRQADIRDEEVDAPGRLQDLKADDAVGRLQGLVSEVPEDVDDEAPHH